MVTVVTVQEDDVKASWRTCQSFNEIAELVTQAVGAYRHEDGSPRTIEDLYADVSLLSLSVLGDFTHECVFRPQAYFSAYTLGLVLDCLRGEDVSQKLLSKTDLNLTVKTWLYNLPSRLTDEQKRLVSAVVLSCWEREDLHFWLDKDGIAQFLFRADPNYCPLFYSARKLWNIVKGNDDEPLMKEVNNRIYVTADGEKQSFDSWKDACEYVVAFCERGRVFRI